MDSILSIAIKIYAYMLAVVLMGAAIIVPIVLAALYGWGFIALFLASPMIFILGAYIWNFASS